MLSTWLHQTMRPWYWKFSWSWLLGAKPKLCKWSRSQEIRLSGRLWRDTNYEKTLLLLLPYCT